MTSLHESLGTKGLSRRGAAVRRWLGLFVAISLLTAACNGDADPTEAGADNNETEDVFEDEGFDAAEAVDVGRIVATINSACDSMSREASLLAQDLADGLVDTEEEWAQLVKAKGEYEQSIDFVAVWRDGVVGAITAGAPAAELGDWLDDLPTTSSEDGTSSTLQSLHEDLQSGALEPARFDPGSIEVGTAQRSIVAAIRVALPLLVRYGPAIVGVADTVIRLIADWQDREDAQEQAHRDRLSAAFAGIDCEDEWPTGIERPTVLWSKDTCAPVGVPANIHHFGSGGEMFETAGPLGSDIVTVGARDGSLVDAIGLVYAANGERVALPVHGGSGGGLDLFELQSGESITALEVHAGLFVNALVLETDAGRSYTFGDPRPTNASKDPVLMRYNVPAGGRFAGLQGQSDVFRPRDGSVAINAIGCTYWEGGTI